MGNYNKHTWQNGELITAEKLNNIENQLTATDVIDTVQSFYYEMRIYSGYISTSDNVWSNVGGSSTYRHAIIPVKPGDKLKVINKPKIGEESGRQTVFFGLRSYTAGSFVTGDTPDFSQSEDWTIRKSIGSSTNQIIWYGTIPADVNYLYIYLGTTANSYIFAPWTFEINGYDYAKDLYHNLIRLNSQLSNITKINDTHINNAYGFVNYGYDIAEELIANTAAERERIGCVRTNTYCLLNGTTVSYSCFVKISNNLVRARSNTDLNNLENPITLISGHTYIARLKKISGTLTTTAEDFIIPSVNFYKSTKNTSLGEVLINTSSEFVKKIVGDGDSYNMCISVREATTLTDYLCEVTLEDITEGAMPERQITISGANPTIAALPDRRYVCGELQTLSFTPAATGICDVIFESGSTATVLTVPNTIKWPSTFNPALLETNTIYEINVMNGIYGVVTTWT